MTAATSTRVMPSSTSEASPASIGYVKRALADLLTLGLENKKIKTCAIRILFQYFDQEGSPLVLRLKVSYTRELGPQDKPLGVFLSRLEVYDSLIEEIFNGSIFGELLSEGPRIAAKMECVLSTSSKDFESCTVFSNTPSLKDAALQFFGLQKGQQVENKNRKDEKKA